MMQDIKFDQILFLDIETVPVVSDYNDLPEIMKKHWDKKTRFMQKTQAKNAAQLYEKAGIFAEFGKIICISAGVIVETKEEKFFREKTFAGHDEKQLLIDFCQMLKKFSGKKEIFLCAHNGKEFDFPYLARRILINGLVLPQPLQIAGKKPWEVKHIDTLELWKFGDYKHYTSLDLLAFVFGIDSPKDDMDGSEVAEMYWKQKDLKNIIKYCRKDVFTVAQLYLKYQNQETILPKNIEHS